MKLVFMGDSITDAFHKLNVDEAGIGNGYVALIAERLKDSGEKFSLLPRIAYSAERSFRLRC